jgi:hypothetical protein
VSQRVQKTNSVHGFGTKLMQMGANFAAEEHIRKNKIREESEKIK